MPTRRGTTPRPKGRQVCSFPECSNLVHGFGLCSGHLRQQKAGMELQPLRAPRPDAAPGFHWCSKCKQFRPLEDFGWDVTRDQPKRVCRSCVNDGQVAYVERKGRSKVNHERRLLKRGITEDEFNELWARQNGACAICGRSDRALDIDHCHEQGHVRGLLCSPCNRGLGFMNDDVEVLRAAIAYLESSNHHLG